MSKVNCSFLSIVILLCPMELDICLIEDLLCPIGPFINICFSIPNLFVALVYQIFLIYTVLLIQKSEN
ncbi:hypothetical protein C2G38_2096392 [Gigaspora rosea]|uniref:Uncharacterized protein n=1 Tax=Gigaspora rosea TaxID=44941 RepID=A0A397UVH2_9GLOM|nr:hypothetical protein C2G38_2096392 [Gigaspora rosea]